MTYYVLAKKFPPDLEDIEDLPEPLKEKGFYVNHTDSIKKAKVFIKQNPALQEYDLSVWKETGAQIHI